MPDRSTLEGARGARFLFTRPFILVPALVATIATAAWFISLMVQNGRTSAEHIAILLAIAPMCGFGFAVLIALPLFFVQRAAMVKPIEHGLVDGETVYKEVRANHFLGDEARGGKLYVTDRRCLFVPHRFNVQLARCDVPLDGVREVRAARIVTPTGLVMSWMLEVDAKGRIERFVVPDALGIGDAIERRVAAATGKALARVGSELW